MLAVEVEETAVNNFGVDVEANGRRLEAEIQVEEAEVGIRFDEIGLSANPALSKLAVTGPSLSAAMVAPSVSFAAVVRFRRP